MIVFWIKSQRCMMYEKIIIANEAGELVEAIAPVIISASRATDIPAFYAKWFFNRLAKGYCIWRNPFNQKPTYISFRNCKVIVFWTKNPGPMLPYLKDLDKRGIHYYFQITLNNYIQERFEPNLPSIDNRIETFKKISSIIGKERAIWRFDPLIVTEQTTPQELLARIQDIGNRLKGYTDKLVFSFVDIKAYRKVKNKLLQETSLFTKENIEAGELSLSQRQEIIDGLVALRETWSKEGWQLTLATCCEEIDLDVYGIEHNRCIDGELMKRIFSEDEDLVYYLHTLKWPQRDMFGVLPSLPKKQKKVKDPGQRKICGCMLSKDIGMYDTCLYLCSYCYANSNKNNVLNYASKHKYDREGLVD